MKISPLVFTILALFAVTSMASPIPWDKQEQRHQEQGKMEQIAGGSFNKGSIEGAVSVLDNLSIDRNYTLVFGYYAYHERFSPALIAQQCLGRWHPEQTRDHNHDLPMQRP